VNSRCLKEWRNGCRPSDGMSRKPNEALGLSDGIGYQSMYGNHLIVPEVRAMKPQAADCKSIRLDAQRY
jgi:hypothetical protein